MVKHLATTTEEEQFYCKALSAETIKINVTISESYHKLIRQLQQENVILHTHQIREERAHRVLIRNLHHSGTTDEIKEELEKQGHTVHNILFFIDLDPKDNNKSMYEIMKITVEAPRKISVLRACKNILRKTVYLC
jgi:hypothetical protein